MLEQDSNIDNIIAGLTPKELRFCQRYIQHLNAARAAREAGYSENSCREIGYENLTKLRIKAVVKHYLEQTAMPTEEAVRRLTDMGRGNIEPFLTEDGTFDLNSDSAKDNIGLIKKIKQVRRMELGRGQDQKDYEIVSTEIELHDSKDAIKTLLEVQGKIITHVQILGQGEIEL